MGPLSHQGKIAEAIKNNCATSISAPRGNGKTYAAIAGVKFAGGRTLFICNGYAGARAAFDMCSVVFEKWARFGNPKLSRANLTASWGWEGPLPDGSIVFLPYSKQGARGHVADSLVFDDADTVDADVMEAFYPAIFAAPTPRIVALSVAPDRGLAQRVDGLATAHLRWHGLDEHEANPGLSSLFDSLHLENAKHFLTAEAYRREHLGLVDGEYDDLVKNGIVRVIAAQLDGQVLA